MQEDKIAIEIVFSGDLGKSVEKAVANGELKDKYDLMRKLAKVYQKEIQNNKDFMKPLRALDKGVTVRVVISDGKC